METRSRRARPTSADKPILWICQDCESVLRREGYILIRGDSRSSHGCDVCEQEANCWPIMKYFNYS